MFGGLNKYTLIQRDFWYFHKYSSPTTMFMFGVLPLFGAVKMLRLTLLELRRENCEKIIRNSLEYEIVDTEMSLRRKRKLIKFLWNSLVNEIE